MIKPPRHNYKERIIIFYLFAVAIYVTGGMFEANGTTSMPKSVPHLILDKVRLLFSSEMFCSSQIKVHNKSFSRELNNVLFTVA